MATYKLDTEAAYKKANTPFKRPRDTAQSRGQGWTSGMIFAAVAVLGLAYYFSNRGMSALATEEEECEDCKQ